MVQAFGQISRLKGFFRSGLNYSNYAEMLQATTRKMSGSLPKDILLPITKQNPQSKGEVVKSVENLFEQTANVLGKVKTLERQAIFRLPQTTRTQQRLRYFWIKSADFTQIYKNDPLFKNGELEAVIKAEETLLNGIKQYFPEAHNVIITPLGSGMVGFGYKVEILTKEGKKVISDKVIKIYRDKLIHQIFTEKSRRFMDSLDDNALLEQVNKEIIAMKKKGVSLDLQTEPEKLRKQAQEAYKLNDYITKQTLRIHGAMAEANAAEYIRYSAGHKLSPDSGIALPSLFGLGDTKFALSEYIGNDISAPRTFEFGRLGIKHCDLETNIRNGINGICIDLGGIAPLGANPDNIKTNLIVSSKPAKKIIKSLFNLADNKRLEALNNLQQTAASNKISKEALAELETRFHRK